MSGMEMMLKSMGFDIAEFQGFIKGMQGTMQKFNDDLETLKGQQAILIGKIGELEQNQRAILGAVIKPPVEEYIHG